MRRLLLLLFLTVAAVARAETCLVVGISDGDTLKVRCGSAGAFHEETVRLADVDAPEKAQPFGQRSRAALAATCFGALAQVRAQERDRYGRLVARVQCRGLDASASQVRAGMAWWYEQYSRDYSLRALEWQARAAGAGLWQDAAPVSPWDWRRARRAGRQ